MLLDNRAGAAAAGRRAVRRGDRPGSRRGPVPARLLLVPQSRAPAPSGRPARACRCRPCSTPSGAEFPAADGPPRAGLRDHRRGPERVRGRHSRRGRGRRDDPGGGRPVRDVRARDLRRGLRRHGADLPGIQGELVDAVLATARQAILVVVSGRPYAIGGHAARADATVQAFLPGAEGAAAIAGVLSGRVNPSGHLPVQIPGETAGQPGTYLAPALALKTDGVSSVDPTPAFPFGHGLSYTTFAVGRAQAAEPAAATDGAIEVSATVTNTGSRAGDAGAPAVPVRHRRIGDAAGPPAHRVHQSQPRGGEVGRGAASTSTPT